MQQGFNLSPSDFLSSLPYCLSGFSVYSFVCFCGGELCLAPGGVLIISEKLEKAKGKNNDATVPRGQQV